MIKINREKIEQSFETEPHFQINLSLPECFKRDFTKMWFDKAFIVIDSLEKIFGDVINLSCKHDNLSGVYDLEILYALEIAISNAIKGGEENEKVQNYD